VESYSKVERDPTQAISGYSMLVWCWYMYLLVIIGVLEVCFSISLDGNDDVILLVEPVEFLVSLPGESVMFRNPAGMDLRQFYANCYLICTAYGVMKNTSSCPQDLYRHGVGSDVAPMALAELQQFVHSHHPVDMEASMAVPVSGVSFAYVNKYSIQRIEQHHASSVLSAQRSDDDLQKSLSVRSIPLDSASMAVTTNGHVQALLDKISHFRDAGKREDPLLEATEWIDQQLCLQVMTNVRLIDRFVPVPAPPSYYPSLYGFHSNWSDIRCQGSLQRDWTPIYWMKPWDWQHVMLLGHTSDGVVEDLVTGRNVFVSVYDVFSLKNIAHLVDSVELFWSIMAAMNHSPLLKSSIKGVVMFSLSTGDPNELVRPFVRLLYRSVYRYCVERGLEFHVESMEKFTRYTGDFMAEPGKPASEEPQITEFSFEYTYPVLLERPLHNVLTPEGSVHLQATAWLECAISVTDSQQAEDRSVMAPSGNGNVVEQYQNAAWNRLRRSSTRLVVLAYRNASRHIANIDDVYVELVNYFGDKRDIISLTADPNKNTVEVNYMVVKINFGSLSPCEQVDMMSQASWFIFVHGAEGGLISFLRPGSVVIEMHPAGCCVDDFDTENYERYYQPDAHAVGAYYYFFDKTVASSWVCDDWLTKMMVSPICGTRILIDPFVKMVNNVHSMIRNG
jgi:hypothetical protein